MVDDGPQVVKSMKRWTSGEDNKSWFPWFKSKRRSQEQLIDWLLENTDGLVQQLEQCDVPQTKQLCAHISNEILTDLENEPKHEKLLLNLVQRLIAVEATNDVGVFLRGNQTATAIFLATIIKRPSVINYLQTVIKHALDKKHANDPAKLCICVLNSLRAHTLPKELEIINTQIALAAPEKLSGFFFLRCLNPTIVTYEGAPTEFLIDTARLLQKFAQQNVNFLQDPLLDKPDRLRSLVSRLSD
eukprot:CAMPEP_0203747232 /NCGR_PEP_ID=MMETSP0098-20131031/2441_1 /ASSEMBLY_ACC=CAM_ASM_000208 /TAXON_ID=96639 /ORGANISM=" , Strain NY0313808BC1" /LENGTH=243 /DNA_ID=CAMNT_0050635597 /DNA_START=283 /DNA_END=1014 /DNA_ORIENTATION=-